MAGKSPIDVFDRLYTAIENMKGEWKEIKGGGVKGGFQEFVPHTNQLSFGSFLGGAGPAARSALGQGSPFAAAGEGLKGAGQIVGMMGPWGKAAQVGLEFTAALISSVDKLKEWGRSLHDGNVQFAQFSASMAEVQANQQLRDIQLSASKGEARAGSAERLAEAMSNLERQTAPIENMWANFKNQFATVIIEKATAVINLISQIPGVKGMLEEGVNEVGHPKLNPGEFIREMHQGMLLKGKGDRPGRFMDPRFQPK